jgi:hypothetical protein
MTEYSKCRGREACVIKLGPNKYGRKAQCGPPTGDALPACSWASDLQSARASANGISTTRLEGRMNRIRPAPSNLYQVHRLNEKCGSSPALGNLKYGGEGVSMARVSEPASNPSNNTLINRLRRSQRVSLRLYGQIGRRTIDANLYANTIAVHRLASARDCHFNRGSSYL